MFWQCTFKVPNSKKGNVTEWVSWKRYSAVFLSHTGQAQSFETSVTSYSTSAWLELPFSLRTVFSQPAHHCNEQSVPTLLPVSAWAWPRGALPAAPCCAGIARGCLSFCCCKPYPNHFTASAPKFSEVRTFEMWIFYQWVMNILILSTILLKSTFAQPHAELKGLCTPAKE